MKSEREPARLEVEAPRMEPMACADREQRWKDAVEIGRRHGLGCTCSPTCDEPGSLGVVVYRTLVAVPCREHTQQLVLAIAQAGHGASLECVPLVDLLKLPAFVPSAGYLRSRAGMHPLGVSIPTLNFLKRKRTGG